MDRISDTLNAVASVPDSPLYATGLVPVQSIRRAVLTLRPARAVSSIGMPKTL